MEIYHGRKTFLNVHCGLDDKRTSKTIVVYRILFQQSLCMYNIFQVDQILTNLCPVSLHCLNNRVGIILHCDVTKTQAEIIQTMYII